MSFIPNDCTNIVMDCNEAGPNPYAPEQVSRALKLDDLKRLHDAGATVTLEFLPWSRTEPRKGAYDWSFGDEMVKRCQAAGMKVILMLPNDVIRWAPGDWYVCLSDGTVMRDHDLRNPVQSWGCLSPWNPEAQAYQNGFIRACCERYNSDDVICAFSHSQEGESLLPPFSPALYDPHAMESYRAFVGDSRAFPNANAEATQLWMHRQLTDVMLAQQGIYAEHPSDSLFMSLHPVYTQPMWNASGVLFLQDYFHALNNTHAPGTLYWIIFSWFNVDFEQRYSHLVRQIQNRFEDEGGVNAQVITGSEWISGLRTNTPKAIASGFRALLTAPRHPFLSDAGPVSGAEAEELAWSHAQFMRAREVQAA